MSSEPKTPIAPLDLAKYRNVPTLLMVVGGVLSAIGFFQDRQQFAYSWLQAFMLFLSLGLGALFLVLVHHLFDAGWSVAIRRFCEHITTLLCPWMLILFLPIAFGAKIIYPWMHESNARFDLALRAKAPLFTMPGFYVVAAGC